MTAYETIENNIEVMKLQAYDYIIKPVKILQMKKIIANALEATWLMKIEVAYEPKGEFKGDIMIGSSNEMRQIYKR